MHQKAPKWRNWQTRGIQNPRPDSVTIESSGTYERPENAPHYTPDTSQLIDSDDADLQHVIDAWPSLPPAMRTGIMAMVEASGSEGGGS